MSLSEEVNSKLQDEFWSHNESYITRNTSFDTSLGIRAWKQILSGISEDISSVLDCGSNIGRNIGMLMNEELLPNASYTAVDINADALKVLKGSFPGVNILHSNLLNLQMESDFDLVFTSGVLIHLQPKTLESIYRNLISWTRKYLIMIEYFNKTPVEISYRGSNGLLWKRDFGREFLELSGWQVHSYGFLWGHEFETAGFDDTTYWVFRRT